MENIKSSEPINILVVEDNPGDFHLLQESLRLTDLDLGDIQCAETLNEAEAKLSTYTPDLVFLDLFLPDSQGLDSYNSLKKYLRSTAVIILSGYSDTKVALEAITDGAQDYLAKGEFEEKLLSKTVIYAIERFRSLQSLRVANERYSLVTKATNDLIWDWDPATDLIVRDVVAVNEIYGFATNDEIGTISQWLARVHDDDRERIKETLDKVRVCPKMNYFELQFQFLAEDSIYKHIDSRGYVVRDEHGMATRIIGASHDVTEKRLLEIALHKQRNERQRAITEATIRGQENEREQLGIELHDNINQILSTSRLYLEHALTVTEDKDKAIQQSRDLINMATTEIRKLSHSLLPPSLEEFGLLQAMDELCDIVSSSGAFTIERKWELFNQDGLSRDVLLTIYRIIQEQVNNTVKHAQASVVSIWLRRCEDGSTLLRVADDGVGFDPAAKRMGVGLRNISSRAGLVNGIMKIDSAPGQGCALEVQFM